MNHGSTGIALVRAAIAGGLMGAGVVLQSGCNWSPPTLAVEMPNVRSNETDTTPEPTTPEPTEVTPPKPGEPTADSTADSGTSQSADALAVVNDTSVDDQSPPKLTPKLPSASVSQLVGRWRDSFFGTRTLTLNADGTATMVLDLDFAGRLLYGKRLEFDMKWSLENGVVTIDILEGRPAAASKSATGTWGSRYEYLLDRVEEDAVEMRSSDGTMNHTLKRISDDQ